MPEKLRHTELSAAFIAGLVEAKRIVERWQPDPEISLMTKACMLGGAEDISEQIQEAIDEHRNARQ